MIPELLELVEMEIRDLLNSIQVSQEQQHQFIKGSALKALEACPSWKS